MQEEFYERALRFSAELTHQNLQIRENETFLDTTIALLDRVLGFHTAMMASLSGTGKKEITPNFITHHVSYALMQQILSAYWAKPEIFDLTTDLFVLSFQPDYKKMSLYRNILKPAGFSDLMLQFVKAPDSEKYLSCILYLSKERSFHADEIDCAKAVVASIAYAHMENIYLWDMRSRVNILIDNMDHYPLGIMLISGTNQLIHINEVAKKYLEDLGVTDTRLYSNFFTSKIYPYYLHNVRSRRVTLPIQIGNYLFNVVSTANVEENSCPAHQIFAQELSVPFGADTILKNMNQLATCVYIIKNELQGAVMSTSLLQEFGLTKRELQLAAFVAEGKNNAEISELMGISTNTVKTHLSNVYKKLGISYRTELMNLLYKMDEESRLK